MTDIKVCYHGKFGVVTDLGQDTEVLGFPTQTANMVLTIPRYGVWKLIRGKHQVVLTTSDLKDAQASADRDDRDLGLEAHMQRLWDTGGEMCSSCGREDYENNMTKHKDRIYCENCAENLEADFEEVAHYLHGLSIPSAEVVATGGGIDCIHVTVGKFALYFGTSCENWGATVYTVNANGVEEYLDGPTDNPSTECSASELDATTVAAAIKMCVDKFRSERGAQ